jgi:TPR repeat protein
MTKLALCCFRGEGIARSVNAGIELLRKAVDLNNEEAILHLFVHRLGISEGELQYSSSDARLCRVPYESFREQFDKVLFRHFPEEETLQKAVGLGNVMAMVLLANRYFSQREVDGTRAVELYRNAVVYDVPEALAGLGHCYRKGVGVPRDHTTANQLFQRAAAAGHVGYMRYLAKRFISGTDPNILQDGNRGVQLYQQLCDRGSKRGIRNFGLLYEKGIEVQKDYRYAAKLFQRAAEMGDRYAVRCLQRCTEPRSAAECAFFEL